MKTSCNLCLLAATYWILNSIVFPVHAMGVPGQGSWETTLQARDFDGNSSTIEGYYDTVLKITWLADASYAGTMMDWDTATKDWVKNLKINGITGWRLPTMVDTDTPGCDGSFNGTDCGYNVKTTDGSTVYSEMASMFYDTLGNKARVDTSGASPQPGWGLTNTGPFSNLQPSIYWSGLEYALTGTAAWVFSFSDGNQATAAKGASWYVWAVHGGDVGSPVTQQNPDAAVFFPGPWLPLLLE